MRALLVLTCLFLSSVLLPADTTTGIVGTDIIVVDPAGFGSRFRIPFRATLGAGGIRRWEVFAEPFYAKEEASATLHDVNLFSLCQIKITAERPEQNPARLTVDFTHFSVPPWIKISREEVAAALFICLKEFTSDGNPPGKPTISVVASPEHKAMIDRVKAAEYDKDDAGRGGKGASKKDDAGPRAEMGMAVIKSPVDRSKELKAALAGPWDSVTVATMFMDGCTPPVYEGFCLRLKQEHLTIAVWRDGQDGSSEGVEMPLTSLTKKEFCAAVLKHYEAAVASVTFNEYENALPSEVERLEAVKELVKKLGYRAMNRGDSGIHIRITAGGRRSVFGDSYENTGWDAFQQWMKEMTSKTK